MIYIMSREPLQNVSAAEIREYYADKRTERDLADAFASVSNKFFWVEDREYDFDEGTREHEEACAITNEWLELMNEYEGRILEILKAEGVVIPDTGRIKVLAPFMARHGYFDANGWWAKETIKQSIESEDHEL